MSVDVALDLLGGLVLEDGRRWGEAASPEQREDARAVLDPDSPPHSFLTRGRGGSKTTDLAAVTVAWLLAMAEPGARAYGAAADRGQAALLVDAIRGYVARTEGLAGAVRVDAWKASVPSGATFEALAADGPGAYGLRPSLLVTDELAQWGDTPGPRQLWEALVSSMPKVPGAKLAVLTTAGSPSHWSYKVLEGARASPAWRVSEWAGPVPWVSETALAEQRRLLTPSQYARLHLNIWTEAEDSLATRDDVLACATLDGPQHYDSAHRYVLAVDLGVRRDRSVLVVAHGEPAAVRWEGAQRVDDGLRVVVDRKLMWRPGRLRAVDLGEVEQAIVQAWESYGRPPLRLDPWQAIAMAQRLRGRGVEVEEFTFSSASVGRLGATLYGIIRDRRLAIDRSDEELIDELASVRLRETGPGTFRLDHSASGHDDQAVTVALAAERILREPVYDGAQIGRYLNLGATRGRVDRQEMRAHHDLMKKFADRGDRTAIEALHARPRPRRRTGAR